MLAAEICCVDVSECYLRLEKDFEKSKIGELERKKEEGKGVRS